MPSSAKRRLPTWVKTAADAPAYFFKSWGLRFWLALYIVVFSSAKDISAIFNFPPEDRPFAKFLIIGVAVAVWDLTRARVRELELEEIKKLTEPVASYRDGNPPTGGSHAEKTIQSGQMETLYRKLRHYARLGFVVSVVFFIVWFAMSSCLVMVAQPTPISGARAVGSLPEEKDLFFKPLLPPEAFVVQLEAHAENTNYDSAFRFEVDNEAPWLRDELDNFSLQLITTKVVLLVMILLATSFLICSSTIVTLLDKEEHFD